MPPRTGARSAQVPWERSDLYEAKLRHADDYVSVGKAADLAWLKFEFEKKYEIKTQVLGPNKGDEQQPKVRRRYVATEANHGDTNADVYAATPPRECKRLLFSQWAKRRKRDGPDLCLMFLDVAKAYFNAKPKRNLFLRLPKEMGLPPNLVGRLTKCAYGTRDAGALWEDCYAEALKAIGFERGKASPCCFVHRARKISIVVHGDDFTILGLRADLLWVRDKLKEQFELGEETILGTEKGDAKQAKILNRIVTVTNKGLRYEADPRHVEHLTSALQLQDCRFRGTTGHKKTERTYCPRRSVSQIVPLKIWTNRIIMYLLMFLL